VDGQDFIVALHSPNVILLILSIFQPGSFLYTASPHSYGCEAWSLTLREERMLRVFENRILRRIFGPERDENGEWRRLYNEGFRSL
jgi:hypothetical protein